MRPSMGSVGDAYDNAMAESFFATLECELLERRRFKTHAEAKMAIFEFIESFHNLRRRHPALGYLSPADFERRYSVGSDLKASEHEETSQRRPIRRAGRDEGTGSAGAEQKNWTKKEDRMPSDHVA